MLRQKNQVAIDLMSRSSKEALKEKYSFEEFLERVSELDITKCNIHWRIQKHNAEKEGVISVDHLIKLEDSINGFKRLESSLNFKPSNLEEFKKSNHHNRKTTNQANEKNVANR